ncbi:hypothetical protein [Actinocorallia populi]|uniref:hypothetical protein n=1 Tax=Actinocorallia populi TaxID=2079200 RepID=UPI000D087F34|nr:hypothetical protein [Actinocorallia populi]
MYTLRDRGRELAVAAWRSGRRQRARLLVDGEPVGDRVVGPLRTAVFELGRAADERARGGAVRQRVRVRFLWGGRVWACDLVETPVKRRRRGSVVTGFVPPEGTLVHRRHAFQERHPNVYALRHVVNEVVVVTAALLGLSALVTAFFERLVPRIDWSWLPEFRLPDWDLPDMPDVDLDWLNYAIPLLVALIIALREVGRRRRRRERERRFTEERGEGGRDGC